MRFLRTRLKPHIALLCALMYIFCLLASSGFTVSFGRETLTEIPLYVDGLRAGSGYLSDGATFIPLRSFCEAVEIEADISWDSETQTARISTQGLELEVEEGGQHMLANGNYLFFEEGTRLINGTILVPIRELAKAFGLDINWDETHLTMNISSEEIAPIDPLESIEELYESEEDFYWLARIISAESANQPLAGMVGVGNVVLNRVKDENSPDTVYDVIFDKTYGVQFSPVTTGSIYDEPTDEAILAAIICFSGYNTVGDSLYFVNPEIGVSSWFTQTRTYVTTIGDHMFYA